MKTFYSEYVQHCMRFYARHPYPKFHTDIDKQNWYPCENALKAFNDIERELLITIYRPCDTIPDNVYHMSVERKISQDVIWKLISKLEYKIAKKRSLI